MSNAIELVEVEKKAEAEMAPVLARAAAFVVADERSYKDADAIIAEIRIRVKDREIELLPGKELATKTWKYHVALCKKYIDDPLEACKTLDRKRTAWQRAEDAKRQAEADRLRREEMKKQAEEKLKLAERLESAGMKEQAKTVLNAPAAPVSVHAPVRVEAPRGQTILENWQARVVDANLIPREYLIPDLVAIGKYAKLMKGKASIPGVEFFDIGTVRRAG